MGLSVDLSRVDIEESLGNMFMFSNSSLRFGSREMDRKGSGIKRIGGTNGQRMFNKTNHIIGLGELEQLDLIVTKLAIR